MINYEANNYYYFAIKKLLELNSLGWLRGNKEAIINNNNNNNNSDFQNALDDALNYQTIEKDPRRISKLKPYINKYNRKGIYFLAGSKDCVKFEKNNETIALNVLYIPCNTKTISVAYKLKFNNKRKKQVILLMISNGKKQHYLAVTDISALFQKISSNHDGDFYCLNCFSSYTTKNKLKEHEEICNNHDCCHIEMPKQVEKILKYNPGEKSLKAPFAIYLDLESLLKKEQLFDNNNNQNNNLKESYTQKKAKHEPSGWAMFTRCLFDKKENKLNYHRGKDCIEKLCKKLKECAMKIIKYEEKEMIPLTKDEKSLIKIKKNVIYAKKSFVWIKMIKTILIEKRLKIIVIMQEN